MAAANRDELPDRRAAEVINGNDSDLIREVEQFLYREARFSDERRFHDRLELFTDNVRYLMVRNRYTKSSKAISIFDREHYVEDMSAAATNWQCSTRTRLRCRPVPHGSTRAWPGPRTRRRAPAT